MSLLLLWNGAVVPTPPAPAVPLRDRFKIATPLRRTVHMPEPAVEMLPPPAPTPAKRVGRPASPPTPPWEAEPWPAPPVREPPPAKPEIPAEIEALIFQPIPLGDDEDDEETLMLLLP